LSFLTFLSPLPFPSFSFPDEETPFLGLTSEDSDDDKLFDFDAGGAAAEDLEESNSHNFLLRPRDIGFQLSFKNLGVRVEDGGKLLLEGVTGRLSSGKLTAVMGPSGAGNLSKPFLPSSSCSSKTGFSPVFLFFLTLLHF
jgi:ABC-type multidrug transport system fused ATPase/permease subunit